MGRRAHAVHCTWRVAQNVQTSLLVHGKKIRLDFLHSAYITDDTLNQNYRRALPNSKNSDYPNISIGAHTQSESMPSINSARSPTKNNAWFIGEFYVQAI